MLLCCVKCHAIPLTTTTTILLSILSGHNIFFSLLIYIGFQLIHFFPQGPECEMGAPHPMVINPLFGTHVKICVDVYVQSAHVCQNICAPKQLWWHFFTISTLLCDQVGGIEHTASICMSFFILSMLEQIVVLLRGERHESETIQVWDLSTIHYFQLCIFIWLAFLLFLLISCQLPPGSLPYNFAKCGATSESLKIRAKSSLFLFTSCSSPSFSTPLSPLPLWAPSLPWVLTTNF